MKIRHLIESSLRQVIIYTDHGASIGLVRQTNLSATSSDRQNKRLIRASEYVQRFDIEVRYKEGRTNCIPDALSRLESQRSNQGSLMRDGILDSFFGEAYVYATTLIEMSEAFKTRLLTGYAADKSWSKVRQTLQANNRLDKTDQAVLPFELDDTGLLYHVGSEGVRRLCIPEHNGLVKEVLQLTHDEIGHPGFHRTYERVTESLYIRKLNTTLREFIRHCPDCQTMASPRHSPYGSLQPIAMPAAPHHTITIDFVVALPQSPPPDGFDSVMSVTDKFSKRIALIPGKTTYTAGQWAHLLLERLDLADWGLPKAIISDRDRKFVSEIWTTIFQKKGRRTIIQHGLPSAN